jgi:hypothetical protein
VDEFGEYYIFYYNVKYISCSKRLKLALLIQSSPLNIAAGFNNILIGRMHH